MGGYANMVHQDGKIKLLHAGSKVVDVLRATKLLLVLENFADEAEAVRSFARRTGAQSATIAIDASFADRWHRTFRTPAEQCVPVLQTLRLRMTDVIQTLCAAVRRLPFDFTAHNMRTAGFRPGWSPAAHRRPGHPWQ